MALVTRESFYGKSSDSNISFRGRRVLDYAFWGNENLKIVRLPNGVESVGNYAFLGCNNLMRIHNAAVIPQDITGNDRFYGVDRSKITLYVPEGTTDAYLAAGWTGFKEIIEGNVEGDIIIPSSSADTSIINLTQETLHLDITPVSIRISKSNSKPGKWVAYNAKKHSMTKLLNKGWWGGLAFSDKAWDKKGKTLGDGAVIVTFPRVNRRGVTGSGLSKFIKFGVWYPADTPGKWMLADKSTFKNGNVVPLNFPLEFSTYNGKTLANDWASVPQIGFDLPGGKTRLAVRRGASENTSLAGNVFYYPATKITKVTVNTYGKPTKYSFKANGPSTLNLQEGTMYTIDGGAPIGPAAKGSADFSAHAGKVIVFWRVANGKKPETAKQAGITVPS